MIEVFGASIGTEERAWLVERLERASRLIDWGDGGAPARVSVRVVDDAEMIELHARASGVASPTDVLTWADRDPNGPLVVDLALGAGEAERHAVLHGHRRREELLLYGVHGLLHAAGFDDRTPGDFERMHAMESRILEAIGGVARVACDARPGGTERGLGDAHEARGRGESP